MLLPTAESPVSPRDAKRLRILSEVFEAFSLQDVLRSLKEPQPRKPSQLYSDDVEQWIRAVEQRKLAAFGKGLLQSFTSPASATRGYPVSRVVHDGTVAAPSRAANTVCA